MEISSISWGIIRGRVKRGKIRGTTRGGRVVGRFREKDLSQLASKRLAGLKRKGPLKVRGKKDSLLAKKTPPFMRERGFVSSRRRGYDCTRGGKRSIVKKRGE